MMENVNNEDQIAKNMEPVQDNTPLDDDFYYENDDFDLDNINYFFYILLLKMICYILHLLLKILLTLL